jgi:hypothetical protein
LLQIDGLTEEKITSIKEMMNRELEEADIDDDAEESDEPSEPSQDAGPTSAEVPKPDEPVADSNSHE